MNRVLQGAEETGSRAPDSCAYGGHGIEGRFFWCRFHVNCRAQQNGFELQSSEYVLIFMHGRWNSCPVMTSFAVAITAWNAERPDVSSNPFQAIGRTERRGSDPFCAVQPKTCVVRQRDAGYLADDNSICKLVLHSSQHPETAGTIHGACLHSLHETSSGEKLRKGL